MNNQERREALDQSRTKALCYAKLAEEKYVDDSKTFAHIVMLADTWANLAQALKKEEGEHDYVKSGPR